MKVLVEYALAYGLIFLILDIARWVATQNDKKSKVGCVWVFLWADWRYKKIRFFVVLLDILVFFSAGAYLILSERASSSLLGVWLALAAWWVAGEIFDKWE